MTAEKQSYRYPGGKNGAGSYQRIINIIPPHKIFIEACAGSGAITRTMKPCEYNILIEADPVQAEKLKELHRPEVIIRNSRWENDQEIVMGTDLNTVIYFDPPYLKETRSSDRDIYQVEWTEKDHRRLLEFVTREDRKIIISHPRHELYERELKHWNTIDFEYMTRRGMRWDRLWYNYPTPERLHDYSFVGNNRTRRQVIDRRITRWCSQLEKMEPRERNALLEEVIKKFRPALLEEEAIKKLQDLAGRE